MKSCGIKRKIYLVEGAVHALSALNYNAPTEINTGTSLCSFPILLRPNMSTRKYFCGGLAVHYCFLILPLVQSEAVSVLLQVMRKALVRTQLAGYHVQRTPDIRTSVEFLVQVRTRSQIEHVSLLCVTSA